MLQKFGEWDENESNLNRRVPYINKDGSYTTNGGGNFNDGTLIGKGNVAYIGKNKSKPRYVRVWVREGTG